MCAQSNDSGLVARIWPLTSVYGVCNVIFVWGKILLRGRGLASGCLDDCVITEDSSIWLHSWLDIPHVTVDNIVTTETNVAMVTKVASLFRTQCFQRADASVSLPVKCQLLSFECNEKKTAC